jgi:hypothetical protein
VIRQLFHWHSRQHSRQQETSGATAGPTGTLGNILVSKKPPGPLLDPLNNRGPYSACLRNPKNLKSQGESSRPCLGVSRALHRTQRDVSSVGGYRAIRQQLSRHILKAFSWSKSVEVFHSSAVRSRRHQGPSAPATAVYCCRRNQKAHPSPITSETSSSLG